MLRSGAGKPETDQSELGIWFHDDPIDTDVREVVASDGIAVVEGRELVAEPMVFPAGSKLVTVGYYDSSVKNRYNPAPDKEVYWAEQSWDEMLNPFFEYGVAAETPTKGSTDD